VAPHVVEQCALGDERLRRARRGRKGGRTAWARGAPARRQPRGAPRLRRSRTDRTGL
jgi:hypothetical protein